MKAKCENCTFFDRFADVSEDAAVLEAGNKGLMPGDGECLRFPPVPIPTSDPTEYRSPLRWAQPVVWAGGLCGEHSQAKP